MCVRGLFFPLCDSAGHWVVYLHQWDASSQAAVFCLVAMDIANGVTRVSVAPTDEIKMGNK